MAKLFEPISIRSLTLKNRIVMSPMCQYEAEQGIAGEWHLVHYGSRAVGGTALIIQEATAVSPEGRITPGDLGIYRDEQIDKLKQITAFIKQNGSIPGIQLAHAGRKAGCARPWEGGKQLTLGEGGWKCVAPSAIPFNEDDAVPVALNADGIREIAGDFRNAAIRALEAGFEVIEIHAAHGYLIHQFLSPLSNMRNDEYGGSFENRTRLLLDIVKTVRSVMPENLPLFVRISATDWIQGGWDLTEAVTLCNMLKTEGVDLIDCSSGGLSPAAKIPLQPGYQLPFSERIRKDCDILTGAVGLITDAAQAEEILEQSQADLIFLGRELLRQPFFAIHAARSLGHVQAFPRQYGRAK